MLVLSTFATARRVTSVSGSTVFSSADQNMVIAFAVGKSAEEFEGCVTLIKKTQVKSAEEFYQLLVSLTEQLQITAGELSAVWFDRTRSEIYVAALNGTVWLRRGEKIGQLLTATDQLKMIQGKVQLGDWYLCTTQSAALLFEHTFTTFFSDQGFVKENLAKAEQEMADSPLRDKASLGVVQVQEKADPVYQRVFQKKVDHLHSSVRSLQHDQQIRKKALRKILPLFAVILLIIVSIIGNILWKQAQQLQASTLLKPYREVLQSAQQEPDQIQAKRMLTEIQKELESLKQYQQTNLVGQQTRALYQEVSQYLQKVSGQVSLAELPVFFDFRLVKANFIASASDVEGNSAVFLDRQEKVVISLNLDTKEQTLLPLSDYSNLQDIILSNEQIYLLGKSVFRVRVGGRVEAQELIAESTELTNATELGVFDNFIYVFNPTERNIYRYLIDNSSNTKPIGWIQDKKDIEFSQINSMSINGSVWLGTTDGKIIKLERGQQVPFQLEGVDQAFNSPLKIFSSVDGTDLFVLEPGQQRVVVLEKTGRFVKEIKHASIGAATGVFAREEERRVYIVAGSTLYSTTY